MHAMAAEFALGFGGSAQEIEVGGRRAAWPTSMLLKRSSESREEERMLQLMMGSVERPPAAAAPPLLLEELAQRNSTLMGMQTGSKGLSTASTPTLFGLLSNADMCSSGSSPALELDSQSSVPLPSGWEKCLDLQTGCIYYLNRSTGLTTSCDPRTKSGRPAPSPPLNSWAPTSPSSSSDLTFEGIPTAAQAEAGSSPCLHAELDLDLSLSLRPSSSKRSTPTVVPSQAISHAESSSLHDFMQASTQGLVSIPRSIPSTSTSTCSASSACQLKDVLGSVGRSSELSMQGSVGMASTVTLEGIRTLMSANACVEEKSNMEGSANDMMTVGCASCLMFVMVRHTGNPKCPRCGSSIHMSMTTTSESARRRRSSSGQRPATASKRAKTELSLPLSSRESS